MGTIINGTNGADVLAATGAGDTLNGLGGNDQLLGNNGDDVINAGDGNDFINVRGKGNDTVDGGDGIDRVTYYTTGKLTLNLEDGNADDSSGFIDHLTSIERISGTSGFGDVITGRADTDETLYGNGGDDTLDGGVGGHDTTGYSFVQAGAGGVNVNLASGTSSGPDGNDVLSNFENIEGSTNNDTLTGDGDGNVLWGMDGDDILVGAGGNDTLVGGAGNDRAVFSGNRADYTITTADNGDVTVQDNRGGSPDGTDTVRGVKYLQFADTTLEARPLEQAVASGTAGYQAFNFSFMLRGTGGQGANGFATVFRGGDGSGDGIYLRLFTGDGEARTEDILVNTATAGNQRAPTAVALEDGTFVVMWDSIPETSLPDGSYAHPGLLDIKMQHFDADGNKMGGEVTVNTTTDFQQRFPSVAATADGGFFAVWQSRHEAGGSSTGIYGQRFDHNGTKVGAEVHINTTEADQQIFALVRATGIDSNADGVPDRMVVAWQNMGNDGKVKSIVQQQVNIDGSKAGAEVEVYKAPAGTTMNFIHQTQIDGGYVLSWTVAYADGTGAVLGRVFNDDGSPRGKLVTIAAGDYYYGVDAITVYNGNLMVVWDVHHADGSSAIVGQNFDLVNGQRVGGQYLISDHGNGGALMYPTLSGSGNGDVLVSWNTQGNVITGDSGGVYQQLINGNGEWEFGSFNLGASPAGTEITVQLVQGGAKPLFDATGHYQLSEPVSAMQTVQLSHLALSGTAAFGTTVTIYSDGVALLTVGVDDDGLWTADIEHLAAGTHLLTAVVTDVHGNASAPSEPFQLTVDNAVINGTSGDDNKAYWTDHGADANAQVLNGGAGNDTIDGAGGADTLNGGSGNDTYVLTKGGIVVEAADEGTDTVLTAGSYVLTANVENATFDSNAAGYLIGNELDNVLTGGDGGNFFHGGEGNDTLIGHGNADFMGGTGNDLMQGGADIDFFIGGQYETGDDTMDGGDGNDVFNLSPGHDSILGGAGDEDTLRTETEGAAHGVSINLVTGVIVDNGFGESGAISGVEEIEGTHFADTLVGSAADEQFISNGGNDSINGGAGQDVVYYGGAANFTGSLSTGTGSSTDGTISFSNMEGLAGGSGNDNLTGSAGNDSLGGFLGDDTMTGLGGNDEMWGLGGNDTAVYRGNKADYIVSTTADGSVKVQDKRTSGTNLDGTDTLHGVRKLVFADSFTDLAAVDHVVSSKPGGYQIYQSTAASWYLDSGYLQVFRAVDGSGDGLYARVFDEDGNPQGDDILINAGNTGGDQRAPVVTSLVYGNYVVAYHSNPTEGAAYDDPNWDVMVQILDNGGHPVGGAINVATTVGVGQRLPSVTGLSNGNFVVTWQSAQAGEDGHLAVYARVFSSDGTPFGAESKVGTMSDYDQTVPVATALQDGGAVITWAGVNDDGHFGFISQRFAADGAKVGDAYTVFEVGGPDATVSAIHSTRLADGGHVLTWIYDADGPVRDGGLGAGDDVVMARNYDHDGNPVGAAFIVSSAGGQHSSSVLGLDDGSYLVVWDVDNADGSSAIMGRRYSSSDNSALSGEFKISNSPSSGTKMFPTLAEFQPGQVVVAWGTQGQAEISSSGGIYQQIIDYNGNPLFYVGDSSGAKPAAPTLTVQTVVGGSIPVPDPAYPSGFYYVKDAPLTTGATTANNHLVVSGTAAVGSTVTIKVGAGITRTVAVDDDGRWALDLNELADGTYAVTATVTNLFKQTSVASTAFNLTVKAGITGTGLADGESYWAARGADGRAQALYGGDGNDTINGGGGADTLNGGAGDDTFIVANAGVVMMEAAGGGTDTVKTNLSIAALTANVENAIALDGTAVSFTGNGLNNVLTGNAGNDTLDGGIGNDTLVGNGGNDTYTVDAVGDVIVENPGGGIDTVKVALAAAGTYALSANVENAEIGGALAVNVNGNDLNNALTGNGVANKLAGGGGNDTLNGGAGNDTLDGGAGNDTLDGGAGTDSMSGGTGDDTYVVDVSTDVVVELDGGGKDTIQTALSIYTLTAANVEIVKYTGSAGFSGTGNAGDNQLEGGALADTLNGAAGNDSLIGGSGNDSLLGGDGNDDLRGGEGNDTELGGNGNDLLAGGVGTGNDSLDGGAGSDTLIGGAGDDVLDGGAITDKLGYTDSNIVSYNESAAGINVNLQAGKAQDGLGGNDKLANINIVVGSTHDDVITGSDAKLLEQFEGGAGDDTIDGGAVDALNQEGNNRVTFMRATGAVTVDLEAGTSDGDGVGHDTLAHITQVRATAWDDVLSGSDSTLTEQFEGLGGDDTIDGRGGIDIVRYENAGSAVDVNLADGTASDGTGGTDTLLNIEGVRGSAFDDTLTGGNPDNGIDVHDGKIEIFMGNGGNDVIDGGDGYDRADYTSSTSAVTVNLAAGAANDGFGGIDTLINIEGVRGSAFNDTLLGSDEAGFESFEGREGNDSIDGLGGVDRADYEHAKEGVVVNLATGAATKDGYGGTDKLLHIEDVRGTTFNDSITGSADDNHLQGLAGNDTLAGGAGMDRLDAGTGVDVVDGGADEDTLVLHGDFADYTIARPTDLDVLLVNNVTGENITVRNVEHFEFANGMLDYTDVIDNTAGTGPDLVTGTPGIDRLDGLGGADTMAGLDGDDVYVVDVSGDMITEAPDEGNDTVEVAFKAAGTYTLGDNVENATVTAAATVAVNLTGNELDNTLTGNAAANKLIGGAGDDDLNGGAGADSMIGGTGNDTYTVDVATDVVTEDVDGGWNDTVQTTLVKYTLGANVENLVYTGSAAFAGIGNALGNGIHGGAGNDTLDGGAGNDYMTGGGGNDSLIGGTGGDFMEGGAGNDTLDGGTIVDRVSYFDGNYASYIGAGSGVVVNLALGKATNDGQGGVDTLISINMVYGSEYNDSITGSSALVGEFFNGAGGNNTIDGGAISSYEQNSNLVYYWSSGNGVNVDLQSGVAEHHGGQHDVLININQLVGSRFDDTLLGTDGELSESFDGYEGNNEIDGRGGFDFVRYDFAEVGVTVNLATGLADNGTGTDTLSGIEGVVGSWLDDELTGGDASHDELEVFIGSGGNDTIDGGLGYDRADYTTSSAAVSVNLGTGTAQDGLGGTDTLTNIEGVRGSAFNDTLTGSDAGGETFEGREGNDSIDGKGGVDLVSYESSKGGAKVDLAAGTASDGYGGTDKLLNIEDARGSAFNDTITGGTGANHLEGLAGNDSLQGGAGNDVLEAGKGVDTVDGGADSDTLVLLGDYAGYTVKRLTATDLLLTNAGTGESITVRNVETFAFKDGDRNFAQTIEGKQSEFGDVLKGTADGETIDGLGGNDTMTGLAGSDTYRVDAVGDVVVEAEDEGTDLVEVALKVTGGTYSMTANVENASVSGALAANIVGNGMDNILTGNAVSNKLDGGAGNDSLVGGAGTDTLIGGLGDDTFVVDVSGDVVTELDGGGTDLVQSALASYTLATLNFVENLAYTGSGNFSGTGNALANVITGGIGKDTLTGGLGNDKLSGGAGDDSLLGGDGADTLDAGTGGNDIIDGGAGADLVNVLGNFSAYTRSRPVGTSDTKLVNAVTGESITLRNVETVHFADGDRSIDAVNFNLPSIGNDSLEGGVGNDTLNGLTGTDTMAGGTGDDLYVVDTTGDLVKELEDEGTDTVNVAFTTAGQTYNMTAFVENATVTGTVATNILGNGLNNVLSGNAQANKLDGGEGNDSLVGGLGTDTMIGGLGNDTFVVDVAGDVVTEADGGGTDLVQTALASYTLAALSFVENLAYTGSSNFSGTGNALANAITGGIGKDTLTGGLGNDSLSGGAGDDSLLGGDGNDTLSAGTGAADLLDGGAGDGDVVQVLGNFAAYTRTRVSLTDTKLVNAATGESLTIRNVETVRFADGDKLLDAVNDNLASTGNDTLTGTDGNDVLNGGAGADSMIGGLGNDTYMVEAAGDSVTENADEGTDLVNVAYTAAGLTYTLASNVENATVTGTVATSLTGNGLANVLTGNGVANKLDGGEGNDSLVGGLGTDTMIGGLGNDTFVVDVAADVVTEADGGGTDLVQTALATYSLATLNFVENLSYTGTLAFSGTGNAQNNAITGGIGKDTLTGGLGNDSLSGGAGDDSLLGGDGNDTLAAGTGAADVLDGGAGDGDVVNVLGNFLAYTRTRVSTTDTKLVNAATGESMIIRGVETVHFADGDKAIADVISNAATAGNDTLTGTDGNDTMNGLAGADDLSGGLGDDTYMLDVAGDVVHEAADEGTDLVNVAYSVAGLTYTLADNVENATVTGTVAANLKGNGLANVLSGNGMANKLEGLEGNDKLIGGAGTDTLIGGQGNDTFVVDVATDVVTELAGEGTDLVETALAAYSLATLGFVENLSYTGTLAFSGTGNALDNILTGGIGKDTLSGGLGNDKLFGGAGDDSLVGGDGDDTIDAGTGAADVIDGGAGTGDVVNVLGNFAAYTRTRTSLTETRLVNAATGEALTIRNVETVHFADGDKALADVNANLASSGNDTLTGGDGDDVINGGAGIDSMSGGLGNDTYTVDVAGDSVTENADAGTDLVNVAYTVAGLTYTLGANIENATVTGTVAANLTGNGLDNILTGNGVANKLDGGDGNDKLIGGAGTDTMIGGSGDDVYVVDVASDVVTEGVGAGTDRVETALATYTLATAANVENLSYTGVATAFTGTGNALANVITGGAGADKLSGAAGTDTLIGGAGADTLAGGTEADSFVLNSLAGIDTVSDFVSGTDKISISQAVLALGDGDLVVEDAETRASAGGFSADAELVVFTANAGGTTPAAAALAIGSATGNYTLGQQALFVVDNGSNSYLYLFKSSGTDAVVSAGELTQIAILTGNPATTVADYQFVA